MVLIARALAQQPQLLVMDEPTSNLDFGNQLRVLKQIRKLAEGGMGIVMTSHFPDHAFLCASRVALLSRDGFAIGEPDEIVTEESLRRVYGVNVKITATPVGGGRYEKACVPILSWGGRQSIGGNYEQRLWIWLCGPGDSVSHLPRDRGRYAALHRGPWGTNAGCRLRRRTHGFVRPEGRTGSAGHSAG